MQTDTIFSRSGSIGMGLIRLIVSKESQVKKLVQELMERIKNEIADIAARQEIIGLLVSVLASKFSKLSLEEIEAMFLLSDIKQTHVYQEAREEGRLEGLPEGRQEGRQNEATKLLVFQLSKRFGKLTNQLEQQIGELSIEKLEGLAEDLLDFANVSDLDEWMGRTSIELIFISNGIKQTRVYQEAKLEGIQMGLREGKEEGRQNEARTLLVRQLSKRFGKLTDRQEMQISELSVEELGEALLDFAIITDLDGWLQK